MDDLYNWAKKHNCMLFVEKNSAISKYDPSCGHTVKDIKHVRFYCDIAGTNPISQILSKAKLDSLLIICDRLSIESNIVQRLITETSPKKLILSSIIENFIPEYILKSNQIEELSLQYAVDEIKFHQFDFSKEILCKTKFRTDKYCRCPHHLR